MEKKESILQHNTQIFWEREKSRIFYSVLKGHKEKLCLMFLPIKSHRRLLSHVLRMDI